jgi:pyridoxine 4-dehydrogenase
MTGDAMSANAGTVAIGADLVVNRLGYGAMRLTGPGMWGEYPDRDRGIALLRRVVEPGITFIDTADAYGPHTNQTLIHDALHPYPADLVIANESRLSATIAVVRRAATSRVACRIAC